MIKADPIIQSSGGLTLVRRVVFMLRGLCQVLGCPVCDLTPPLTPTLTPPLTPTLTPT